jgi:hypothetical protein
MLTLLHCGSIYASEIKNSKKRTRERQNNARPESIEKATKAKCGNHHQDKKLHDHRAKGQDHEIVFQSYKSQPA